MATEGQREEEVSGSDPAKEGLTQKTFRGLQWSTTAVVINSGMQVLYMSVMARLLDPAAYGLMAMAMVVIRFGKYFSQMGVMQAIIQKKELHKHDIQIAFTGSLFLGLVFSGIFFAAAPLVEMYFREAAIVPIVRVLALSFLITGLSSTSIGLLRRRMNFKAISIGDVASYVISYGLVGIPLALSGYGVWSLVWASLAQPLTIASVGYFNARHSLKLYFSWKEGKALYGFGSKVSLISFLEFMRGSLDTMLIGRWFGDVLLGLYNRSFLLVSLPMEYFMGSFSKVFLPALSRIQDDTKRLREVFVSTYAVLQYIILSLGVGMCAGSENIVFTVLGGEWGKAIPVLQVLSLAASLNFLSHLMGVLLEAKAKLKGKIWLNAVYLVLLGGLFWSFRLQGLVGFTYAILIGNTLMHIWYLILIKQALGFTFKTILPIYARNLVGAALVGASIWLVGYGSEMLIGKASIALGAQVVAGGVTLLLWLKTPFNASLRALILDRMQPVIGSSDGQSLKGKVLKQVVNWIQ